MFTSLAVQVVVYQNSAAQLLRLARGLDATLAVLAKTHPGIGRVAVRFGDCWAPSTLMPVADELNVVLSGRAEVAAVELGANLGSGGGSNALAELGDEDLIWVLNPDTYPSPQCASQLVAVLSGDQVGAADARQMPIEHPKEYDRQTGDTSWVSGASMMLRRAAFQAVGGFDADFFPMYCDDVDISWRLRAAGWRTCHAPRAALFHDKRLDVDGRLEVSDFERRSSALARLWLCRRYGRPDLEQQFLVDLRASTDSIYHRVADEFEKRVASGNVPAPVEHPERVAQFVGPHYATHRFGA